MARRQTTREAKKLKDKWKAKQWYSIVAPDLFNRAKIGETLADEPEKLVGRTVEVTLQDLTGDFRMMHIKLKFKIVDHTTTEAFTKFMGHDLTSDFIRRQTRRKRTKMEGVFDVTTKDGYTVRVKPMAISDKRIQSSVQYQIRRRMDEVIRDNASKYTFSQFTSLLLTSDRDKALVSTIQKSCKNIYPLKRIDIRRMEVLSYPEGVDDAPIDSMAPVPEEEPEPEEDRTPAEEGTENSESEEGESKDKEAPADNEQEAGEDKKD